MLDGRAMGIRGLSLRFLVAEGPWCSRRRGLCALSPVLSNLPRCLSGSDKWVSHLAPGLWPSLTS